MNKIRELSDKVEAFVRSYLDQVGRDKLEHILLGQVLFLSYIVIALIGCPIPILGAMLVVLLGAIAREVIKPNKELKESLMDILYTVSGGAVIAAFVLFNSMVMI